MKFLMAISAVVGFVPLALAAPSGTHAQKNIQKVNVVIQQIKATSEMDITVLSEDTSQVLGYACSNTLKSGALSGLPIAATVDENGAGTLAVGSKNYTIHEDPKTSGGISCARMYNDVESFMTCAVPVPVSLLMTSKRKGTAVSSGHGRKKTCFNSKETPSLHRAYNAILAQNEAPAITNVTRKNERLPPHKRQVPVCDNWTPGTSMVGNGNPHQNYLNTQLSETMNCGTAPLCTVGQMQSSSYTIGWSASSSATTWISGGFDVSESWSTGDTYSCTANSNETVCVWYNTAHTAYTVQNGVSDGCWSGWIPESNNFVMYSPNANNIGGGYYCVIGTCRGQDQQYWNYNGPAGGP